MSERCFSQCTMCNKEWPSRESFVCDPSLRLDGYMPDFEKLDWGLLLFTHMEDTCQTTLALHVQDFMDMYDGPVYSERKTGGPDCPGYCKEKNNLERCSARCECAYARELMQLLKEKQGALAAN
jgi:hypothetical protein